MATDATALVTAETPSFDLDDLPMEVFELADRGLTVESLTAGHGLTEYGASSAFSCSSSS